MHWRNLYNYRLKGCAYHLAAYVVFQLVHSGPQVGVQPAQGQHGLLHHRNILAPARSQKQESQQKKKKKKKKKKKTKKKKKKKKKKKAMSQAHRSAPLTMSQTSSARPL